MSKKRKKPPTSAPGELIEARVAIEREWAHARWLERMTWPKMRLAAALPPEQGGLGYDLSPAALKGLVAQARADHGDLTMSRDERVERQQAELDDLMRHLRESIARAAKIGGVDTHSIKLLLDAQKREAELHGLAAPTQHAVEVVHTDAVTLELNAMLERAGQKPLSIPER